MLNIDFFPLLLLFGLPTVVRRSCKYRSTSAPGGSPSVAAAEFENCEKTEIQETTVGILRCAKDGGW